LIAKAAELQNLKTAEQMSCRTTEPRIESLR